MAPRGSSSKASNAATSSSSSASPLAEVVASLPLTWPIPNPSSDESLVPTSDIALEQDLLLNRDSLRAWRSYIAHVEQANYQKRSPPDVKFSPAEAKLLGPLASSANRLALKRIVSIYERALSLFPTSYALHRDYLFARARFVLGEPKGGYEALRKRIAQNSKKNLDIGPSLIAEEDANEEEWQWMYKSGGGLDGTVGYQEWVALVAACERSLRWMQQMPRLHLFYLSLFLHPLCPAPLYLTHARRTFDRSLRLLPPSLHLRVWKLYLRWAERVGGETGLRVWRRYLRVDPSLTERYIRMLLTTRPLGKSDEDDEEEDEETSPGPRALEAAKLLLRLATDAANGSYKSPEAKAPHQLFLEWLELVDKYPEDTGLDEDDEEALSPQATQSLVPTAPKAKQAANRVQPLRGEPSTSTLAATSSSVTFPRPSDVSPLDKSLLPVRNIILSTLSRYSDQAGRLWTGLATYHLKKGELDLAKKTFTKGMNTVVTVRDFTIIFDAFAESEEGVISYLMGELEETEDDEDEAARVEKEEDLDQRMQSFEELMESRPFLVNDVMLRRNPDDVQEWEKRVVLYGDDDAKIIETYKKAMDTINPRKATTNYHQLFLNFARFYEVGGAAGLKLLERLDQDVGAAIPSDDQLPMPDLEAARKVFERAITIPYKRVDDLAEVWISWSEMELRHQNYDAALRVMARATQTPRQTKGINYHDDSISPQARLFKSLKLWSFYSDLEESIGSTEGAKRVYDRILELKIANAQTIINYAAFLEERDYHEDSFKVYERGVESFGYPIAFEIWNVYLSKFTKRYGGSKIERARDLFEQALSGCPDKFNKLLFLKYGALEEEYGLAKRAMKIYERATKEVAESERFDMFTFYIAKTASNFGLAATRGIYEAAIEVLPDRQTAEMCLRFASLERKLGEIDRSRAIYKYASQFCDPRITAGGFWKEWNGFEIETGSEDTFREMLRIKRSVQAQYNTDLSYISASAQQAAAAAAATGTKQTATGAAGSGDAMARLEAEQRGVAASGMFVSAKTERGGGKKGAAQEEEEEQDESEEEEQQQKNSERVGDEDDDDDLM